MIGIGYKHSYVVNAEGYQIKFVLIVDDVIQYYKLKSGEMLVDTHPGEQIKPRWNGAEWTESATAEEIEATKPSLAELKAAKKQEIATVRWQAETAGLELTGFSVATDRESQAMITAAVLQTLLDPTYTVQWKTSVGFITLTSEQIQAVGVAVRQHVQACFDREAVLLIAIEACETAEELNAIKWEVD